MFKNFVPYNDFVLLQLADKEQKTDFGLIFTSDETKDYIQATVMAWPDEEDCCNEEEEDFYEEDDAIDDMVGKKVILKKHVGIMLDDTLFIVDKKDILGFL